MNVLFLCSQNKLRSPTAENIFLEYPGIEVASAGLNRGADVEVSDNLLVWADIIFVMEKVHLNKLRKKYKPVLNAQKIICLNIPDDYDYMDQELIHLLKKRVIPRLMSIKR